MISEAIHGVTFCEKEIALPSDIWTITKLEYSDERSRVTQPKVIHVECGGVCDEQILVKNRSPNERPPGDSTSG